VNGDNRLANIIGGHDINSVGWTKRKNRETCEHAERLDHIKLRGFGAAAVTEHDGRAKNGALHVRKKLMDHVFAEFFGAGVWVVVGAPPIDGVIFLDDFVLTGAGDGDGGDVGKAAQTVMVLCAAGQLNHFKRAAQIYVEALLFRLAIERSRAVNQGIGGFGERMIVVIGQANLWIGEVAKKNTHAGGEMFLEFGELHVQLQRLPQALASFLLILRANKQVERIAMAAKQSGGEIAPDISG